MILPLIYSKTIILWVRKICLQNLNELTNNITPCKEVMASEVFKFHVLTFRSNAVDTSVLKDLKLSSAAFSQGLLLCWMVGMAVGGARPKWAGVVSTLIGWDSSVRKVTASFSSFSPIEIQFILSSPFSCFLIRSLLDFTA